MGAGVTLDALAAEPQFLSHLAPVWRALPVEVRGTFHVADTLAERAQALGIDVVPFDVRRSRPQPPPRAQKPQGRKLLVASIGDTKIGRRRGYGDFARLEHGAGQAYRDKGSGSYAGGEDNDDASLILVPNDYSAGHWRRAYPSASVAVIGSPRLDKLPRREPDGLTTIAFAFHWPCMIAPETNTALYDFAAALPELAKRYHVIGTQHPSWRPDLPPAAPSKLYARAGIEFVPDFEDICRRADLLVFDNTSAGFEFAATGRPVVVLNAFGYRKNVHHGGRFWDWATVGPQVDAPEEPRHAAAALVWAIDRALALAPQDVMAREAALALVYSDRRPGAAERAAAAIAEWARVGVEVAA